MNLKVRRVIFDWPPGGWWLPMDRMDKAGCKG